MELAQIEAFLAVARGGGFSAAAKARGAAPSSITRSVAALENALGVRLFERTTRNVRLTAAGDAFLARASAALEELEAAADQARTGAGALRGRLRVSASVSYGQIVMAPLLPAFRERYPALRLDLVLSDAVVDIVGERIDIAIRHGRLNDSGLIARPLHPVQYWLVASPDYLKRAGPIRTPRALADHDCLALAYPNFAASWRFARAGQDVSVAVSDAALTATNAALLLEAARQGAGAALLADWTCRPAIADGSLVRVLAGWRASGATGETAPVSIVTPSRTYRPAKTRAFVDFMVEASRRPTRKPR